MALTGETIRKLGLLKLPELVPIIAEQESIAQTMSMTFDERMDCIVDQLYQIKNENRIQSLSKSAKLKYPQADLSSMLFLPERELDRAMFINISSCVFVQTCKNIVLFGPTGCGKSFAACVIGKAACRHLYKTKYIRFPDLMSSYKELTDHSARVRFLRRFSRYDVLVIDEWLKDVPDEQDISFMFELSSAGRSASDNLLLPVQSFGMGDENGGFREVGKHHGQVHLRQPAHRIQ